MFKRWNSVPRRRTGTSAEPNSKIQGLNRSNWAWMVRWLVGLIYWRQGWDSHRGRHGKVISLTPFEAPCPILIFYSVGRDGDWRRSKRLLRTWKLQEIRELSVSSQVNFCLRSFLQRPLAERSSRLARGDAWRSGESSEGGRHWRGHRRAAWRQPWSGELWELRVWRQGGER